MGGKGGWEVKGCAAKGCEVKDEVDGCENNACQVKSEGKAEIKFEVGQG